ncbi:retropepsin-like aspartic protease [Salipiger abyssi]|uniref:retropepsin-like aspartic protease n=1 Tax=Salipiger abyssi TaxID=1250539 RepID=UPI00097604BF|nr:retropepsin-like aspartic protease [Salipiger abyssi]
MITERIFFMDDSGKVNERPSEGCFKPVVPIALAHTNALSIQPTPKHNFSDRFDWALIDTGADENFIDDAAAARLDIPEVAGTSAIVRGATATHPGKIHTAPIILIGSKHTFYTNLTTAPLSQNGRKYSVILGIRFLKQGRLLLDFEKSRFEFRKL